VHGNEEIKIPSGTQNGDTIQLKGKGVPHLHGRGKGNQFVNINVDIPKNLNKKQRELLEELAKVLP
jgi:molecular chaperone DnaJ